MRTQRATTPDSRIEDELPNARGYMERMHEDDSHVLHVEGWMMTLDGPFENIALEVEDTSFPASRVQRAGIARAFPWVPHSADAGFKCTFPIGDNLPFAAGEVLRFSLVGSNHCQRVAKMKGGYYRSSAPWTAPPSI